MLYVAGHTAFDHLLYVENFPAPHTASPITHYLMLPGGSAANCSVALASLDQPVSLLSVVGEDFDSSGYSSHLSKKGIDLSYFKTIRGELTARAFMSINSKNEELSYFYWGAARHLAKASFAIKPSSDDILLLTNGSPQFNMRMVSKHSKTILAFDPGYDIALHSAEDFAHILPHLDFLFLNDHELANLLHKTHQPHPKALLTHGPKCIIITHGEKGSEIFTEKEHFHIPSFKAKCVDPTGAGDAYRAGFLAAFERGEDLETCGRIGSSVASFVIEKVGAQSNCPSWKQAITRAKKL